MYNVALAEDFLLMRETLSAIISCLNDYKLSIVAENGFKLIEKLNSTNRVTDIAIIDVDMPVMDGLSATNFLKSHYPNIRVLAISNHTHPFLARDMFEAGARGYLLKDNLSKDLLSIALKTIQDNNLFIDDAIKNKETILSPNRIIGPCTIHPEITEKEKTFLQLTVTAITYDQIAELMYVAKESVYNYQKSLSKKIGLRTRQEFMLYSIKHGIAKVVRLNSSSVSNKENLKYYS